MLSRTAILPRFLRTVTALSFMLVATSAASLPPGVVVLFEDNIDAAPVCANGTQCFLNLPTEFSIPQVDLSGQG